MKKTTCTLASMIFAVVFISAFGTPDLPTKKPGGARVNGAELFLDACLCDPDSLDVLPDSVQVMLARNDVGQRREKEEDNEQSKSRVRTGDANAHSSNSILINILRLFSDW